MSAIRTTTLSGCMLTLLIAISTVSGQTEQQPVTTTHTYKQVGKLQIKADVIRFGNGKERPVIVWCHGGALLFGSRDGIPPQIRALARQEDYVLVSIDYRLGPQAQLDDILNDLKDAIAWVRKKGTEFGANPSCMVVAGHSAGGYLALMSGVVITPPVQGIVSYAGFCDVDGDWVVGARPQFGGKPVKHPGLKALGGDTVIANSKNQRARWQLFVHMKQNGSWTKAMTGLDPRNPQDLPKLAKFSSAAMAQPNYPPTILVHGRADQDVAVKQSEKMATKLKQLGVQHQLVTISEVGHSLVSKKKQDEVNKALTESTQFIKQRLEECNPQPIEDRDASKQTSVLNVSAERACYRLSGTRRPVLSRLLGSRVSYWTR